MSMNELETKCRELRQLQQERSLNSMTDNEKEILHIWSGADESGKAFIIDLLTVAVAFGDPFYNEMQTLDRKDKDAMRACIAKYKALAREGATV